MAANSVSKSLFSVNALALLRQVEESGTSLIVTDNGKPVVEVRRYRAGESAADSLLGTVLEYSGPLDPVSSGDWDAAS
jgi:antitoxin (DNA-binding transcriptional repressor) of toxin-antitoxin stability system